MNLETYFKKFDNWYFPIRVQHIQQKAQYLTAIFRRNVIALRCLGSMPLWQREHRREILDPFWGLSPTMTREQYQRAVLLPRRAEKIAKALGVILSPEQEQARRLDKIKADEFALACVQHAHSYWEPKLTIEKFLKRVKLKSSLAKEMAECLEDLRFADAGWFREAYEALLENKRRNGFVWQNVQNEGMSYEAIRAALKAYRRHNNTNYDELLRSGMDQKDARLYACEYE